jgi:hypothetical protein
MARLISGERIDPAQLAEAGEVGVGGARVALGIPGDW